MKVRQVSQQEAQLNKNVQTIHGYEDSECCVEFISSLKFLFTYKDCLLDLIDLCT